MMLSDAQGKVTLSCWSCMKRRRVDVSSRSRGQMQAAEKVGWIAAVDFRSKRLLFFCSRECEEAARTKKGFYRKARPVG
jgi:hypothetical protein